MRPLTVRAHLTSPMIATHPLMLDGILYFGIGRIKGREAGGAWVSPSEVYETPLPLEAITAVDGWWWAASQAIPLGGERGAYMHRRTEPSILATWTTAKSLNRSTGPDKSLRTPIYYRWRGRFVEWTCVGDPLMIGVLLAQISSLGAKVTHGWGGVERWEVLYKGPELKEYRSDLNLRHLPVSSLKPHDSRATRMNLPLRPPYHNRRDAVAVYQVRR